MKAMKSEHEVKIEDLNVKFGTDLIDCSISELGRKQTEKAAEELKDVNVTLVISSPLRRCLETTRGIFKDHKNKPKVIVWPVVKEMLLSSCDVSDDLATIKSEFPDYDFSLLDQLEYPELWLAYALENEKIRQEILDELFRKYSNKEEALKNAKFFLTEKLKNIYPSHLEDQHDLNKRVVEAKDRVRQMLREQKEGESLVVVAHSRFLESWSAQRYEEDGTPVNAKWFANCEVAAYEL